MWADQLREQAEKLPPGPEREALLQRASQADTATSLDDWAHFSGPDVSR